MTELLDDRRLDMLTRVFHQGAADASGQYWRYQEPIETSRHGRQVELASSRALPAQIAADSRLATTQMTTQSRSEAEALRFLSALLGDQARVETGNVGYNQPRADAAGQAFDSLRDQALGRLDSGPARGGGAGPVMGGAGGAGRIPPGTPSQAGPDGTYYWDGSSWVHEDDF